MGSNQQPDPDPSLGGLASVVDLARRRAAGQPDAVAFVDRPAADGPDAPLTYAGLDRRARALAATLVERGLGGERAILLGSTGVDFVAAFLGCLYAKVVAVPAHRPRPNRPMPNLAAIAADSRPRAILAPAEALGDADRWAAGAPALAGLPRIATDAADPTLAERWANPEIARDDLAFLQYTSGSTAAPRGVMVSHGNLLDNLAAIRECFAADRDSRGVCWLPLFHDMGLIGGVLQTIYCGGRSLLMAPASFLQDPARWLRAIGETGATISGGPDFAYDLCVRKVGPEQKRGLDLSRWAVAYNGAEPVRAETLDRFAAAFAECGFRREAFLPCYGLAESTLLVSGRRDRPAPAVFAANAADLADGRIVEADGDAGARPLVGSGALPAAGDLAIVDPATAEPCPPGRVGEIWTRGPGVAQGYWGNPAATAETFHATLAGQPGGHRHLRTGDLGFVRDGQLFVAGRLKDMLVIRGRNVFPQDVEATVERCHPALRPAGCAVVAVPAPDGGEAAVVLAEVERSAQPGPGLDEAIAAIRRAAAEHHDLDLHAVALVRPLALPRTTSGKIRRRAGRDAYEAGTLDPVASWTRPAVRTQPVVAATRPTGSGPTEREIAAWLVARIAATVGADPVSIHGADPLAMHGVGSLQAVALAGELEAWLGRPLPPTLAYEYPTVDDLARFLAGSAPALAAGPAPTSAADEPIAIIGVGCRFPGADGPDAYWDLLSQGREAVGEPSPRRRERPGTAGGRGGYLDEVDGFDAAFWGIAPREAARMDPQQRLLLEVTWEAFESAGLPPGRMAGAAVGVFVGIGGNDYARIRRAGDEADVYDVTGNAASIAANRISYAFDFRGPSLAVDTACSSSLVAAHLACASLRRGESAVAVAAGVNLLLHDPITRGFARGGFLSPDGRCKAFAADADGYVRGEGAAAVVLKPLSAAIADGDPILAVIRGGAVNQDGRSNGLTAPSPRAQEAVIRAALRDAGVRPDQIDYVEAHGTGTPLGDPIEARALGAVLGAGRDPGIPCLLGSAKGNVGHLEAAAGVAGLVKVALMLRHREVVPTLHADATNPRIPFDSLPLRLAGPDAAWPGPIPAKAGVSSFGFGGTNAHLVLEAAPEQADAIDPEPAGPWLFAVSGRTPDALRDAAARLLPFARRARSPAERRDLAHTLAARRDHHEHRAAIVADDPVEAIEALAAGREHPDLAVNRQRPAGRPGVVFVFSGQGALWDGAGLDLLDREPAFRAAYEACDRWMAEHEGRSLVAELRRSAEEPFRLDPAVAQPHQFALQVALAALWRSWGVVPDAVAGHSLGEIAAAHAAGVLTLEDALRVVCLRGKLTARALGRGRTAAVGLPASEVRRRVGSTLAIAAENGRRQTTVSGPAATVDRLVSTLRAEGVFARPLDVAVAFHGPQMDPLRAELVAGLAGLQPRAGSIPIVSTVTGAAEPGTAFDADHWGRNLRDTVLFSDAIAALAAGPHEAFVEVGPHPIHLGPLAESLATRERPTAVLGSIRRDEDGRRAMLRTLADLATRGVAVAWPAVHPGGKLAPAPTYPWQRERFWIEPAPAPAEVAAPTRAEPAPPVHEVRWVEAEAGSNAIGEPAGRWTILGDGAGLAARLGAAIEARGGSWAAGLEPGARGVVDLRPLDADATVEPAVAARATCRDIAELVAGPDGGRVWVVTRGAWAIEEGDAADRSPVMAPAWGLGRSLALEQPRRWGGLIDLEPGDADPAEALADRLVRDDLGGEMALRQGRALVPRLTVRDDGDEPGPVVRPEGTYLITGGLGDLGLRTAGWLADRGARRLVLIGRRGLPSRDRWDELADNDPDRARVDAVVALERRGVSVVVEAADVGSAADLAATLGRLRENLPPIRGVVHAAGVVEDAAIGDGDFAARLDATFRPKADGAWALHTLTRDLPLDFFVLYSSVAGTWGAARSAGYAAANAFLDGLAAHRRGLGLPALSVAWGPWAGGGMAADAARERSFEAVGLEPLDPGAALAALGRLSGQPGTHAVVARARWDRLAAAFAGLGRNRLLADLHRPAGPAPYRNGVAHVNGNGHHPRGVDADARLGFFRDRVAQILGLEAGRLDLDRPLHQLGFDSIMAMELNLAVEGHFGRPLPLSTLLEGPSVRGLAAVALEPAGSQPEPSRSPAPADAPAAPTLAQQAMWYAHHLSPSPGGYNIAGAARVLSTLDPRAFRAAVDRLSDRHDALRTAFPADADGRPALEVMPPAPGRIDVAFLDAAGRADAEIDADRDREAARPFDLEAGPLARIRVWTRGGRDHVLLLVVHHLIADFWTTTVLLDEFGRAYRAELEAPGSDPGLEPLPVAFTDVARWQAEWLAGPEGERLWYRWRDRLAGPLPQLALPTDRPRPTSPTQRGALRHLEFDRELSAGLVDLARRSGVSLYTALLAGFQALLGRLSGQDDVVVGSPLAGRTRPGLEGLVGYLVNLVPMRGDLGGNPRFDELLGRTRRVVHEALEGQDFPFAAMLPRLGLRFEPGRPPVYQVLLIHQKSQRLDDRGLTPFALAIPGYRSEIGGLALESLSQHNGGAAFDLTLMTALVGDGRLALSLEYAADLFDPATADRLLAQFRTLLAAAVADPARRLADLPLMDAAERHKLTGDWARGPALDPARAVPACAHGLFEAHAARTPGAEAVVFGDERLAYGDLNGRANRLAHRLIGLGVGPGVVVGLHAGRTPALMVGLLAILKAGGAYLPLDPTLPASRLDQIRADSGVAVVVTDGLNGPVAGQCVVDLRADSKLIAEQPATDPGPRAGAGDLAYVIYTSGSTGTPKGVMVEHRNLVRAYLGWERAYGLDAWAGRHLQIAGAAFDVFSGDWVRALGSGGALIACPREAILDPEVLADLIDRERIDCAEFVPAGVAGLVDLAERTGRGMGSFRLIAVGSDLVHAGLYQRLRQLAGPGTQVVNSYGLTETTIDTTFYEGSLDAVAPDRPAPVGGPFAGSTVYVLDDRLEPLAAGAIGELYIGGTGVTRGYLNRPALTADRFLPDPFGTEPGARLYRSGDLARWRPDGSLEILGRADSQVKVRGYRIELGEVESALLRHPAIRAAAVVVREDRPGERRLAAFVVPADPEHPPAGPDLRTWLKDRLPDYMVPATFAVRAALPLSSNGKIDRRALAAEAEPEVAVADDIHPDAGAADGPRTGTEANLARIAAEVLGVPRVGRDENLFERGIDSVLIIQMVTRCRAAGLRLDPVALFRHPTVAELAARSDAAQNPPAALPALPPVDLARFGPDAEDAYPLTPVQRGMLFQDRLDPTAGSYVEQITCELHGVLDPAAFERAWRIVLARHPALRTEFPDDGSDRPVQVVRRDPHLPVTREDWSALDPAGHEARLADRLRLDRRRGFDPARAPLIRLALIRLADDRHALIWSGHHLVFDGWCLPTVLGEVLAAYETQADGFEPAWPPAPPFRRYVEWLEAQDLGVAEAFWRENLAGFRVPTPPSTAIEPGGVIPADPDLAEAERWLDAGSSARLAEVARAAGLTVATIVHGAWLLLLARHSGRPDVVAGVAVSGRPAQLEGVEAIVGSMVNALPLRVAVDEEAGMLPWLAGVRDRLADLRRFEHSPPVLVRQWSGLPPGNPRLFDALLVVQNDRGSADLARRAGRLGVESVRVREQASFPLTVTVEPGDRIRLWAGFDPGRHDADAVGRALDQFAQLLAAIAADPHRRLADLALAGPPEHLDPHPPAPDDDPALAALDESELDAAIAALRRDLEPESLP